VVRLRSGGLRMRQEVARSVPANSLPIQTLIDFEKPGVFYSRERRRTRQTSIVGGASGVTPFHSVVPDYFLPKSQSRNDLQLGHNSHHCPCEESTRRRSKVFAIT
jgi:hypothetical protein